MTIERNRDDVGCAIAELDQMGKLGAAAIFRQCGLSDRSGEASTRTRAACASAISPSVTCST